MNVLIIGSGGREHALAWKIAQSPLLSKLIISPGNTGTSEHGENRHFGVSNFEELKEECLRSKVDLVVVGPEAPLVDGVADFFKKDEDLQNIPVIGPTRKGAILEGSKEFAKEFMKKYNVPTAQYAGFSKNEKEEGLQYLEKIKPPYVLKADGLAAGKGVLILDDLEEAKSELRSMLGGKFGKAGETVLVEEYMEGIELSVFVLTDGKSYVILPEAKDYKQIGEKDTGLNTGGMGAVSPVVFAEGDFLKKVEERIVKPTIDGLTNEGIHYKGFIFIGLMNIKGDPYVVEYNVRMGDPEAEVVLPRIKSDFLELLKATGDETLEGKSIEFDKRSATTVMLVSGGYPGQYDKGKEITGLDQTEDCLVFHAGTLEDEGKILTNGGRVIALTAFGNNMDEALEKCYRNAEKIQYDGKYYRKDIGFDLESK